jgi:hypothetical protein
MQTTVTIDDDIAVRVERRCVESGQGFAEVVNSLLRAALDGDGARSGRRAGRSAALKTYSLGLPRVSLECVGEALAFAEDEDCK